MFAICSASPFQTLVNAWVMQACTSSSFHRCQHWFLAVRVKESVAEQAPVLSYGFATHGNLPELSVGSLARETCAISGEYKLGGFLLRLN